jgi:NAD(P)-dependent dehydrogenase (short-subunit alcohol dehydrogenase family)
MLYRKDLLLGKVIVITGGGTGLGKAMGRMFGSYGAKLCICGRRQDVIDSTAKELQEEGIEVFGTTCNVADQLSTFEFVEQAVAHFGRIDVLVNNAAANFVSPTKKLTPNAFKVVVDTVLMGTINYTMEIGKRWISQSQRGTIINIVTGYASTGSSYVVPSACAKAGVVSLTKSLAVEWAPHGIRCLGIAPGQFPTDGAYSRILPNEDYQKVGLEKIPMKRYGKYQEIAHLASFLLSDEAEYITGEIVHIDGGFGLYLAGEFNSLSILTDEEWGVLRRKARSRKPSPTEAVVYHE